MILKYRMALESELHALHIKRVNALIPEAPRLVDLTVLQRIGMDTSVEEHKAGIVLPETEFIPQPLTVLKPLKS